MAYIEVAYSATFQLSGFFSVWETNIILIEADDSKVANKIGALKEHMSFREWRNTLYFLSQRIKPNS